MTGYTVFGEHLMIQVPGALLARFEACLAAKIFQKIFVFIIKKMTAFLS
jgi:hypothetical protein